MTKTPNESWTLQRLDRLLEAYGSNDKRWPGAERAGLAVFLAANAEARKRVREAAAFDAVLDKGGATRAKIDARLLDRIVAAAAAEPRTQSATAVVVPFKPRAKVTAAPARRISVRWREVSLLAATLLVGFYIGAAGIADHVFTSDSDREFESALVVLPVDAADADEDTL